MKKEEAVLAGTPLMINMEPGNQPLKQEIPALEIIIFRFHVKLWGVQTILMMESFFVDQWKPSDSRQWRLDILPFGKTNMATENRNFLYIGDISSNGWCSIVMLVSHRANYMLGTAWNFNPAQGTTATIHTRIPTMNDVTTKLPSMKLSYSL